MVKRKRGDFFVQSLLFLGHVPQLPGLLFASLPSIYIGVLPCKIYFIFYGSFPPLVPIIPFFAVCISLFLLSYFPLIISLSPLFSSLLSFSHMSLSDPRPQLILLVTWHTGDDKSRAFHYTTTRILPIYCPFCSDPFLFIPYITYRQCTWSSYKMRFRVLNKSSVTSWQTIDASIIGLWNMTLLTAKLEGFFCVLPTLKLGGYVDHFFTKPYKSSEVLSRVDCTKPRYNLHVIGVIYGRCTKPSCVMLWALYQA